MTSATLLMRARLQKTTSPTPPSPRKPKQMKSPTRSRRNSTSSSEPYLLIHQDPTQNDPGDGTAVLKETALSNTFTQSVRPALEFGIDPMQDGEERWLDDTRQTLDEEGVLVKHEDSELGLRIGAYDCQGSNCGETAISDDALLAGVF